MFVLFILSFTSGTLADFPKEITVNVCTGDNITLPWVFTTVQPETVLSLELFKHTQDQPKALVAAFNPTTPSPSPEERTVEFCLNSDIHLSPANLSDAGDYQVIMTLEENSESYSYHAKVRVSEAPVTTEGGFYAKISDNIFDPDTQKWQLRLECGAFQSLGHPPVSVVWKIPSGQTVASTSSYNNSIFYLTLPDPIEEGEYSCLLDETSLAITCLPSDSLLKTGVTVNVERTSRLSLLEGNLESLKGETQSLSSRVIFLLKSVDDSKSEIERMANAINVLKNEELVNLTSRWNGIEILVKDLKVQNKQLTDHVSKLHNVKVNTTVVDELVDRVLNLENRNKQLTGEMSMLWKDKQNLTDAVLDIQSKNNQLAREVNKLSNEKVNTTVVTNLMRTDLDLQTQNSQLTREVNKLFNEKVNTTVVTNLMLTDLDLQTQNIQLTREVNKLSNEKVNTTVVTNLMKTVSDLQNENSQLTREVNKLSNEKVNTTVVTNLMKTDLDLQTQNSQLTREVNKLSIEKVNTTVVTNLMKTVSDLQTQNSQLTREVNRLSNEKVNTTVVTNLMKTVSDLQTNNRQLTDEKESLRGMMRSIQTQQTATTRHLEKVDSRSTYVRWGRNDCPNTASLVYDGEVGGSWFNDAGSAANRLCLSKHPTFDSEKSFKGLSKIMGAVYEGIGFSEHSNIYCAVCLTTKSTTIMVPGTNACPTGWTRQYWGHLTAGFHLDKGASEYLCLDSTPQGIKRPGHLGPKFFYTLTECAGNLPCPPYRDGKVVMCAVCSI